MATPVDGESRPGQAAGAEGGDEVTDTCVAQAEDVDCENHGEDVERAPDHVRDREQRDEHPRMRVVRESPKACGELGGQAPIGAGGTGRSGTSADRHDD